MRVYSVTLVEPEFYERDEIDRLDETRAVRTIWKPLDGFLSGSERLYPEGIVELLATVPALLDPARDQHVAVDAEQILAVETRLLDLAAQGANRLRFPRESPSSRAF